MNWSTWLRGSRETWRKRLSGKDARKHAARQDRPLGVEKLEERALMVATPAVSVASPTVFLGENVSLTLKFDNTGDTTGYGPYIDLFLDTSGQDGNDGFDTSNLTATYLGQPLPVVQVVDIDAFGKYVNPLTGQYLTAAPGYTLGDKVAILELPFGSFTAGQPEANIVVSLGTSDLADLDVPLTFTAIAGFQYGNDALDNPTADAPIRGAAASGQVNLQLWTLTKTYLGPEDETATGPNFRRRYLLEVDIADGQTIDNVIIRDLLAASMQYTGASQVTLEVNGASVVPFLGNFTSQPSINTPGGTLAYDFGSVTGQAGVDASLEFEFFVTLNTDLNGDGVVNGADAPVVPQGTDSTLGLNTGDASGGWVPLDPRDPDGLPAGPAIPVSIVLPPNAHTLQQHSLATQKGVTAVDRTTLADLPDGAPIVPGQTLLRYDIEFQVSDYFAFEDIFLEDFLSDGQRFFVRTTGNSTAPTLFVQNAYTNANTRVNSSGAFSGNGTVNYQEFFTTRGTLFSDPSAEPTLGGVYTAGAAPSSAANAGETFLRFNISAELLARAGLSGKLVGGNVANNGGLPTTGGSPNYGEQFQGTIGRITFYAEVKDEFSDEFESGDRSVDQLDILSNRVPLIQGTQLDTTNLTTPIGTGTDDTGAEVEIPIGDLTKTIVAVNGQQTNLSNPVSVQPGDLVTYRLTYTLPISSFEDLRITDYLPLPVFPVPAGLTFDSIATPGTIPAENTINLGVTDDYFDVGGVNPFGTSVQAATTGNLTGYNATGVGSFSGVPGTIDGVALATGNRVLVKNQTDARQNGIYVFNSTGNTLTRVTDHNEQTEIVNSKLFRVNGGTVNGGQHFRQSNKLFTTFNGAAGDAADIRWTPFASIDPAANSFTLDFGTYDDIPGNRRFSTIDLLVTLRVADAAFASSLFLTNQMRVSEGSTNAGGQIFDEIVMFDVIVPTVTINKGVVGYEGTGLTLGGIAFAAPNAGGSAASGATFTGVVDTTGEANAIGGSNLNWDVGELVDAGDRVRFGIVLQNTNRGDAYDVSLNDSIPFGFEAPTDRTTFANDVNLTVRRGDGVLLANRQLVNGYARVATTGALTGWAFTTTSGGQFTMSQVSPDFLMDGMTLENGDRVLIKNQGTASQNGVYVFTRTHNNVTGNEDFVLTRATDTDTAAELSNYVVAVMGGLTNADRFFTAGAVATLNTSNVNWTLGGTIPDYYYNYNVTTRRFDLQLTDQYNTGNTLAASRDDRSGGLSRGQSGTPGRPGVDPILFPNTLANVTNGSNTVIVLYDLIVARTTDPNPATPNQSIVNTANLTHYAKTQGGTNTGSGSDTATVVTKLPISQKEIISTSVTQPGNTNVSAAQGVIGEIVTYRLTVTVPEGSTPAAVFQDTLDNGLAFVRVTNVTLSSGLTTNVAGLASGNTAAANGTALQATMISGTTVTGTGRTLQFRLGDILNANAANGTAETITIEYETVILNIAGNQAGTDLDNNARFTWTNNTTTLNTIEPGQSTGTSGTRSGTVQQVRVVEPAIVTVKEVRNTGPTGVLTPGFTGTTAADNGDVVEYRIQLQNLNAAGDTTAWDVTLDDPLPPTSFFQPGAGQLAIVSVSGSGGGTITITGGLLSNAFVISGNTLTLAAGYNIDMQKNTNITITLRGTFAGATGLVVPNIAQARWSSLDGTTPTDLSNYNTSSRERTGADGPPLATPGGTPAGTLNDYWSTSTAIIESPPLVYKQIVATSESHTGVSSATQVSGAIGEIVRYRLWVSLAEGVSNNFQVVDFLPDGMQFINDGTARFGLYSNGGNVITSAGLPNITAVTGGGIDSTSKAITAVNSANLTGIFADNNVATSAHLAGTAEGLLFTNGQDVFFRFGTLTNTDNDTDNEFVIIEFNALVMNVLGNQSGTNLDNSFGVLVDTDNNGTPGWVSVVQDTNGNGLRDAGDVSVSANDPDNDLSTNPTNAAAASNNARVTVVEPHVTIDKKVIATTGSVVTYRVTVTNEAGANRTDAFDVLIADLLNPAELTLASGPSNFQSTGGASGTLGVNLFNTTAGNSVGVRINRMPTGSTLSFDYVANVTVPVGFPTPATDTIDNTATETFTSLPGSPTATGTPGSSNPTWAGVGISSTLAGAVVADPGFSGNASGERNGQDGILTGGTLNNYKLSDTEKLGSIGDRVYYDLDADGVQDPGEVGIQGVQVTIIYDANGDGIYGNTVGDITDSTINVTTGADGKYVVYGLPIDKTYKVSVPATVAGMAVTDAFDNGLLSATSSVTPTLTAATPNPRTVDFGYRGTAQIGDRIYLDTDGDGVQDANGLEPSLPGVDVTLTWYGLDGVFGGTDDIVLKTTSNNAAKNYLFDFLPTGNFKVAVSATGGVGGVPDNTTLTDSQDNGVLSATAAVELSLAAAGDKNLTIDFGYKGTASIGDKVWYDHDGDGVQDANEPGIFGATVTLTWAGPNGTIGTGGDDVVFTTTTAKDGTYKFPGLPVNGASDPYQVVVTMPTGFNQQTYDKDGTGTANKSVHNLGPTEDNVEQDFGYRGNAQLGDFVWEDKNGNGKQDGGEPGINGVTVELLHPGHDGAFGTGDDLVLATTTTKNISGKDGSYFFSNLAAGDYRVRFGKTDGTITYERTPNDYPYAPALDSDDSDADPTTGTTKTYTVALGDNNTTIDAGLYRLQDIGDTVWYDLDDDTVIDGFEPRLPNVKVTLDYAGLDGVFGTGDDKLGIATQLTLSDGTYKFEDRVPGTYKVNIDPTTLPTGVTIPTYDLDGKATANVAIFDLTSGKDRLDADFGYRGDGSIGDRVFLDIDNDGKYDAGEGLDGVTVTLSVDLNRDGTKETYTTVTSGDGFYKFDNLAAPLAGLQYTVTVTQTDLPRDSAKNPIANTVDPDGGNNSTSNVTLDSVVPANMDNDKQDFGYRGPGSLGDTVFLDENGNGLPDTGEGINGVLVTLTGDVDGDGTKETFTTKTAGDGTYLFAGLPIYAKDGLTPIAYQVVVDENTLPDDVTNSVDPDGGNNSKWNGDLSVTPNLLTVDFGYVGTRKLGDTVWIDQDADGILDPEEAGIPGVKLTLTADLNGDGTPDVVLSTTTGLDGKYDFTNLPRFQQNGTTPIDYTVTVDPTTLPRDGFNNPLTNVYDPDGKAPLNQATVQLPVAGNNLDVDFGYRGPGLIGDFVWLDLDGKGDQDAGEPGIALVKVQLQGDLDGDGVQETFFTVTDDLGAYTFPGLPVFDSKGTQILYTVTVIDSTLPRESLVATPLTQTKDADGVLDHKSQTKLPTGVASPSVLTQDFGYVGPGSIGDRVFLDEDADGKYDAGEGINGAVVTLTADIDGDGTKESFTTTTTVDGFYKFVGLPIYTKAGTPISYVVTVNEKTLPDDVTNSVDPDGGNDSKWTGNLVAINNLDTVDFGYVGTRKLGDYVWVDQNADGKQDTGEPGITGVKLTLTADLNGDGTPDIVLSTTTDKDGKYLFENLPRFEQDGTTPIDYTVTIDQTTLPQDGFGKVLTNVSDPDGKTPHEATVQLPVAGNNLDVDFGYVGPGLIGDYVWLDADNDKVQDAGEPGIQGVTVRLTADINGDGLKETFVTKTNDFGKYEFVGVPVLDGKGSPISYIVTVDDTTLPRLAGTTPLTQTKDPDVLLDNSSTVSLPANVANPENLDQDFGYRGDGSIGDRIFLDVDKSGKWSEGEGLSGVKVYLEADIDGDGTTEKFTTVTAKDGFYEFPGLPVYWQNGTTPITYTVTVDKSDLPFGVDNTADPDGTKDSKWTGDLTADPNLDNIDFGYRGPASLGDLVWIDSNADGKLDVDEAGITGVKVYLEADLTGDGINEKFFALTDATGIYGFSGLPVRDDGNNVITYVITIDQSTLPLGVEAVSDPDTKTSPEGDPPVFGDNMSTLTFPDPTLGVPNPENLDQDFGYRLPGVIGDTIFLDVNNNGLPDPGEGLGGVEVRLTADLNGDGLPEIFVTKTNPDGTYLFTGLPFQRADKSFIDYVVDVDPNGNTLPPAVFPSKDPDAGTPDAKSAPFNLTKEAPVDLTLDFGFRGLNAIEGHVYVDSNNDGKYLVGELGIGGHEITLTFTVDADGTLETVTVRTDSQGFYSFSGLPALQVGGAQASYIVTQPEQPTAYLDGGQQWRGEIEPNTQYEPFGIPEVLRPIVFDPGVPETAVENNFGELLIPRPRVPDPEPARIPELTVPRPDNGGRWYEEWRPRVDDGFKRTGHHDDLIFAGVEGIVFSDLNNNGVKERSEPGIGGVLIKLVGPSNRTAVTDDDGRYSFDQLPVGTYSILEVQPKNYNKGKLALGSAGGGIGDDVFTDVGLSAGQRGTRYNFGELPPARLVGKTFLDRNRNGVQDPDEIALPGMVVMLHGADDQSLAVQYMTLTGLDGQFAFENLRPGTYKLTQIVPPMMANGKATGGNAGGDAGVGQVGGIELAVGQHGENFVFPVHMTDIPREAFVPGLRLRTMLEGQLKAFGLTGSDKAPAAPAAATPTGATSAVEPKAAPAPAVNSEAKSAPAGDSRDAVVGRLDVSGAALYGSLGLLTLGALSPRMGRRKERESVQVDGWESEVERLFGACEEDANV